VPSILIKYLEQAHREAMGCYFEIKVYEKERGVLPSGLETDLTIK
jgi:hypothetical protein